MWRVGKKVPINVYDEDRPVCQCHSEEDAKLIVEAVNMKQRVPMLPNKRSPLQVDAMRSQRFPTTTRTEFPK